MKVFLDDIRDAPDGTWHIARSAEEARKLLEIHNVTELSLDHDLGYLDQYGRPGEPTGYDLVKWMIDYLPPAMWPLRIYIHTANPTGRANMFALLNATAPRFVTIHNCDVHSIGKI